MSKVTTPNTTFEGTGQAGNEILLKNRKEGKVVYWRRLIKKLQFFTETSQTYLQKESQSRWNNLTEEQKTKQDEIAENIKMTGEAFYKMNQKKSMIKGHYAVARYGQTRFNAKLETVYG